MRRRGFLKGLMGAAAGALLGLDNVLQLTRDLPRRRRHEPIQITISELNSSNLPLLFSPEVRHG